MTSTARKEWAAVYKSLSDGQAGLLGAITAAQKLKSSG